MGWFPPQSIFGISLAALLMLAASARGEEADSFAGIGRSFFEQPVVEESDDEFVHYVVYEDEFESTLTTLLTLPPLPELLPPKPVERPVEAESAEEEEVEKPAEAEKVEAVEPEVSYGYLDYIPYGQYYHVDYYFGKATWKNSAELGYNGQTGNTESTSLRVGAKLRRDGLHTIFTAEFKHLRSSNAQGLTQNNAYFNHKLEWPLKIYEQWSLFEKTGLEYDAFKAFDMRLVFNGGLSYKPYKTDATDWTLSLGSGFSQEFGSPQKGIIPEATMGSDLTHQITERQSFELKFDFYPAFEADQGYRSVTDASYKIALDHGLSLKLSAVDRYDSTPNNRKRNDLDYACLLLWEF